MPLVRSRESSVTTTDENGCIVNITANEWVQVSESVACKIGHLLEIAKEPEQESAPVQIEVTPASQEEAQELEVSEEPEYAEARPRRRRKE